MVFFYYGGQTYAFRNPSLGNSDEITIQRVNRRSRGGDLILFRDSDWPKTEVLKLTFDFDQEADKSRLLNFVRFTLGAIIQYRDHENRLWQGIIQNPNTEATQSGRNTFVIDIQFEGDQV